MLRLATYNIQKGLGHDMRRKPDRTLAVLREMDADIVALQEADKRFGAREGVLPGHGLERLGYEPAEVSIRPDSHGWHGNAVLVRGDVEVLKTKRLDLPHLEPRGAIAVVVALDGVPLLVIAAHLALGARWRRRQAEALAEFATRADMPVVVCGDLNEWRDEGRGLAPLQAALTEVAPGPTFPALRPIAPLDRLYHCGGLQVEARVHLTPASRRASDHLPVVADLAAPPG